jgi:hypothetical protein
MVDDQVRTVQGAGTGLMDTIRRNPIPAAMAAIGVAWLWRSRSDQARMDGSGPRGERSPYGHSPGYPAPARSAGPGVVGQAGQALGGAAEQAGQAVSEAADRAGSAVSQVQRDANRAVDDVARHAATTTRQAQTQLERLFDDSPLVVGAAAVGAGALVAALLPNTAFEERLYGEPRDRLVDEAEAAAHEAIARLDSGDQAEAVPSSRRITSS